MNLNELEWKRFLTVEETPVAGRRPIFETKPRLFGKDCWKGVYYLDNFIKSSEAEDIWIYVNHYGSAIVIQVSPCGTMYRLINE